MIVPRFPIPGVAGGTIKLVRPFLFYVLLFAGYASAFPFIVIYYQGLGFSGAEIGLLTGISPLVTFFGAPFWTRLADSTRRHRLIMSLTMGAGILAVCLAAAPEHFRPDPPHRAGHELLHVAGFLLRRQRHHAHARRKKGALRPHPPRRFDRLCGGGAAGGHLRPEHQPARGFLAGRVHVPDVPAGQPEFRSRNQGRKTRGGRAARAPCCGIRAGSRSSGSRSRAAWR